MDTPKLLCGGRFQLTRKLGEGGMATVWMAYDHRLQVWRAIKMLLPAYAKRRKLRQRFLGEAQAMARLEHRNIVRVYDVGEDGPTVYIVMEMVRGGALEDWLELNGCLPPRLAVRAMLDICDGIQAAHDVGIIHRDVKPHNVLLTTKGVCKVTDFGIAQVKDTTGQMTRTGTVMGTLGFMAPEQRTDAKHIDERADVYSLGASLFTMITARTSMDLFAADQDESIMADIGATMKSVIAKATRYHPKDRYRTVDELSAALRELLPSLPADPASTPSLFKPPQPAPPPPELPDSVDTSTFSTEMEEDLRPPPEPRLNAEVGIAATEMEVPTVTSRLQSGFEAEMGENTTLNERSGRARVHPDDVVSVQDESTFEKLKEHVSRTVRMVLDYAIGEGFLTRFLLPIAIIVTGAGVWLNLGAESVNIAKYDFQETEKDYLQYVYADREKLAEEMRDAGVAESVIGGTLDALQRAKTYEQQVAAAGRFVEASDSAIMGLHTTDPTQRGKKKKAMTHVQIMKDKRKDTLDAFDTWFDNSNTAAAGFAIRLRLAEAPPS